MAQMLTNNFVKPSKGLDFSRSLFAIEKRHSTNLLSGAITPVFNQFLYPGMTPDYNFGCVIESAPLISTCMDNIYVDVVLIWCPIRLVMTDYNEWLGESHTQAFTINRNIKFPKLPAVYDDIMGFTPGQSAIYMSRAYYAEHFLGPHFGFRYHVNHFRAFVSGSVDRFDVSNTTIVPADSIFHEGIQVLPSRIYELNWNTFFRNENVQTPILIDKTSAVGSHDATYEFGLGKIQFANKLKDYFVTSKPAPSLLDVSIAMDEYLAPVITGSEIVGDITNPLKWIDSNGVINLTADRNLAIKRTSGGTTFSQNDSGFAGQPSVVPANLVADLSQLTVNRMYYALMLQKFAYKMEKGRRAPEFIETFFGVKNSEAGHDLPLLICQKRYPLNISQVITTANSTDTQSNTQPVGSIGAYGVTGFGGSLIKNFLATEHGYLQAYLIIRGQPSYGSGIDRHLAMGGLFDTFITQFDHIGPVGVECLELSENYFLSGVSSLHFGFTNYGNDIRKPYSDVVGIMEPGEPLAHKTLAVDYSQSGGLVINDKWLRFNPTIIDRIFLYKVCGLGTGLFTDSDGVQRAYDAYGEPSNSNRYQFLTQFVVKGNLAAVMSPDGDPLQMRL